MYSVTLPLFLNKLYISLFPCYIILFNTMSLRAANKFLLVTFLAFSWSQIDVTTNEISKHVMIDVIDLEVLLLSQKNLCFI